MKFRVNFSYSFFLLAVALNSFFVFLSFICMFIGLRLVRIFGMTDFEDIIGRWRTF